MRSLSNSFENQESFQEVNREREKLGSSYSQVQTIGRDLIEKAIIGQEYGEILPMYCVG